MSKNSFKNARKALGELNSALGEIVGQVADSITLPIEHFLNVEEEKNNSVAVTFEESVAQKEDIQKRAVETAKANAEERRNRQDELKNKTLNTVSDLEADKGELLKGESAFEDELAESETENVELENKGVEDAESNEDGSSVDEKPKQEKKGATPKKAEATQKPLA